jgi:nucleoside 2-deoxyribosyltransferase
MGRKRRVYISGPMTGMKQFNFPKFYEVERRLKAEGFKVVNPARLSKKIMKRTQHPQRKDYYRRDLRELSKCDAIYLMDGWEKSEGASWEFFNATKLELDMMYETWEKLKIGIADIKNYL